MQIIRRALEEPIRQIAINAGVEGSVIVNHVMTKAKAGYGYDALKNEYGDMFKKGIIDPTKVTRSALQNAASVAAMILTTESLVTDIPKPEPPMPRAAEAAWAGCTNRISISANYLGYERGCIGIPVQLLFW